jgi:hypothetical protein
VRTEGKVPVTSEYDNASVHDQGNDSALAECSAVLGKNATCFGGILWDAKRPDPEFASEGREPDEDKSAQAVDVYATLHTVMTTFPFLCPFSTYR